MGNSQSSGRDQHALSTEGKRSLQKYYDGRRHWSSGLKWWIRFRRPQRLENGRLAELHTARDDQGDYNYDKREFLDPWLKHDHKKFADLETYYSTVKGIPRRLIVQATKSVLVKADDGADPQPCSWGRTKVRGDVPWAIWLSELCLNPFGLERDDGRRSMKRALQEGRELRHQQKKSLRQIAVRIVVMPFDWMASVVLTVLLGWIILILISAAIITTPWTDDGSNEPYAQYDIVHWYWPKHAINRLDRSPPKDRKRPLKLFASILPKRLVVRERNEQGEIEWKVKPTSELCEKNAGTLPPYVFLSFCRKQYPDEDPPTGERSRWFRQIAQSILEGENTNRKAGEDSINAFWVDFDCVTQEEGIIMTEEIHAICNAVRCAKRVYILLPEDCTPRKQVWGSRLWTLPEVLLAADKIRYCITGLSYGRKPISKPVSLTDMEKTFWTPQPDAEEAGDHHEKAIPHLVDHYTNRANLSELQIFSFAIQGLAELHTGSNIVGHKTTSLAYAAMGLMAYRIEPDDSDNVFQAVARLCLVNDSNQLLERLLCLWPYPAQQAPSAPLVGQPKEAVANSVELLRKMADPDQYGNHLWDVHPLCTVAGVGDDKFAPTLIVDRARGIPIRWKSFPRLKYTKDLYGFRSSLAQCVVYIGAWFLLIPFHLLTIISALGFSTLAHHPNNTTTGLDSEDIAWSLIAVAVFFGIGWIISWFSPLAVRQLCNGGTNAVSSHLVGIEGTLPLKEIEKAVFGNCYGRLSYAPSTTPFSEALRNRHLRIGKEPELAKFDEHWVMQRRALKIPDTHRLFTIVDTGDLSVSVIAAERPPVVALVCGREGGMLRTLLCSWRFDTNTLFRESVMRMRSSLEEVATVNDWLKISLASQGDVGRMQSSKTGGSSTTLVS
ncbi:hypothetical protein BJY04DRAFT_179069 [Aspergillus karnatakaensis]|uniref:uncharacterized protein n=1 Tax=Aspergillus karnatakaensis TaxID=1810916 RepID=UPI003CCDE278